jgi:hypothetical protein
MDLNSVIYGSITLLDAIKYAGAGLGALIILSITKKLLFTKKDSLQHARAYHCKKCGWQGNVGAYARACPKCNTPIK